LDVEPDTLNPHLFSFQRAIVAWALRLGRCAVFADCGLGKTLMQLSWADEIVSRTGKPALILTPLAVAPQTVKEAHRFEISASFAASADDVRGPGIYVTNYQKLDKFDTSVFSAVVLDESQILKCFTGSIKQALCERFASTPFRLACSATPAPNDHLELGNHADFLGIMPSNEMISRWFLNDTMKAGGYRLKGHAREDFWRWVASWAVCLGKPSHIGYSDEGYDLPPLELVDHVVRVDVTADAGDSLFRGDSLTATSLHKEMRKTAAARAAKVAELVNASTETWVVWCNTDYEADELRERIPDAIEVSGKQPESLKEKNLDLFSEGKARVIITKPTIAGFGLNWQHCCNMAFVGLSYSFEQLYQGLRRSWRFGQRRPVKAHLVYAETEGEVLATVRRKQQQHEEMQTEMAAAAGKYFHLREGKRVLTNNAKVRVHEGTDWILHHGDCVEVLRSFPSNSIDFGIHSPPFANLYIYSNDVRDMGNCAGEREFFEQYRYAIKEMYRATVPGRLVAIHCKDLPLYAGRDGAAGLADFPGAIIAEYEACGWTFHSRVTIWKCPVTERERTNNLGLLHKTVKRDSSQIRTGMADYLIVMRKTPEGQLTSEKPIERPKGFDRYVGRPDLDPRKIDAHPSPYARKSHAKDESIDIWRRYAEPVWWDVDQTDVLNYKAARSAEDERHICPLQLGVIARAVEMWSQPGEVVFSPFAGIGSEGYGSLLLGRKFVGAELKIEYVNQAIRNMEQAVRERSNQAVSLFAGVEG
jgi:DNA modification methylase